MLHHSPVLLGVASLLDLKWQQAFEFSSSSITLLVRVDCGSRVVMYERIARCRSSPPSMALVRLFLMVCTKCSTCPLDCAVVGDMTLCCMPHIFMKSLNSWDVNCVPSFETIHLGTPIYVKISLRCLITLIEWRLCSFLTMGNLLK